ncbi:Transcriptional regulator WAR1 [Tolypocladium ophioglossoides CBS 100239]|uniref:Transcriptional regulator WAR1 n=1 Tax=Tolypocladium ophioglossoides (strain CBS 100239) TaxID=1163406 RepID=A0A0L0NAE9_TOLOC|nr:Transcriptional regulator WAR1 [Tolypocladium ophioglossoides CBS 100239]
MAANMPSKSPESTNMATAKWGAACAPCASAKSKCIRSDDTPGSKCDRSNKMPTAPEGLHGPGPSASEEEAIQAILQRESAGQHRTAQIEERLNGLVNLLQATGELNSGRPTQTPSHDGTKLEAPASSRQTPSASPTESHQPDFNSWAIPDTYNSYAVSRCICRPESGGAPLPPDSDDVLLDLYRNEMQPVYPFVIIPPNCTAATLHSSRPFLMAAIRMVASFRSLRSMRAQMAHLMTHIADHMLVRSERSLDLLQGIIVMLGWYQYHCFMHAQMNNLLSLAMSLIAELGLNKPPGLREQVSLMVARPVEPPGRTNEERRALAALWFLTSAMATTFGKTESMRYSSYLQECVNDLEASREYGTDTTLIFLVRIQHLTERIFELNARDRAAEEIPGIPTAPTSAYIYAFQNELDRIRNNLPQSLKMDSTMQVYLNTALLRLYEPPLADMALIRQLSESLTVGTVGTGTPLDKIYQTSSALKMWFHNWLSVPVSTYYRQPTAIAAQLVYALTMLGRWAKLATPRTMYEGGTPMPRCSSAGNTSLAVYNADPQLPPNRDSGIETSPAYHRCDSKDKCVRETEPGLPAAVGALQTQLQTQPGLTVNIPEILSAMCSRFEQVNSTFQITSTESGKMDNNIWSFSALKVRITRVKLERWAELVSAGAEASNRENRSNNTTATEQWKGSYPQQTADPGMNNPGDVQFGSLAQDQTQIQNFLGSTPWTSDLLDGIDPTVWFDGYLDWGAVIMNSMGTVEQ